MVKDGSVQASLKNCVSSVRAVKKIEPMARRPTESNEELVIMAVIKVLRGVCERWEIW